MKEKISRLENEIVECKKEYEYLLENSKTIKESCVDEIVIFVQDKCKKEVEYEVKSKPVITNSLGIEKLKVLKENMNKIIEDIKKKRDSIQNSKDIWTLDDEFFSKIDFGKGDNFGKKYNMESDIRTNIGELIKILCSDIYELLDEYGYLIDKPNYEKKNGKIIYKYGMSLSDELEKKAKEYQVIFSESFGCAERLYKLNKELEETKALFLWEQA